MNAKKLETWIWVLIYGGLALLMLGLWTTQRDGTAGPWLALAGLVTAITGAVLVWVRSRLRDDGRGGPR